MIICKILFQSTKKGGIQQNKTALKTLIKSS